MKNRIAFLAATTLCATSMQAEAATAQTTNDMSMTEKICDNLASDTKECVQLGKGLVYKRIAIDPLAMAHVLTIDTKYGAWKIKPYLSDETETTSEVARKLKAIAAVNGGFFNLSDGESTSYVFVDGKQLCEPKHNMALISNAGLKPFLTKIFNRSELRFLKDKNGAISMRIQPHDDMVPKGYKLIDSLQAGPQLLPNFTARPEAFVRNPGNGKEVDSIGGAVRAARTAFGIKDDGTAVIVCVQGRKTKEFAEGISLPLLADFMRRLGCTSAINFDGGTSTTMVLKLPDGQSANATFSSLTERSLPSSPAAKAELTSAAAEKDCLQTVVSSSPERKVKSVLYVMPL